MGVISAILLDEIPNQYGLYTETELNNEPINKVLNIDKIWVDRVVPVNVEEKQLINILYASTDFEGGNTHSEQSDGENLFFIDCYARGVGKDDESAAQDAKARAKRLAGVVWAILMSPHYVTLGIAPGTIQRRKVIRLEATQPTPQQEAEGAQAVRIVLSVEIPEQVIVIDPTALNESYTTVKLEDTELGHFYEVDTSP